MDAAVLCHLGEPPRCGDFPEPAPGEGEVLVQVRAAALKPVDKQLASGTHYASPRELPVVCGTDGVGVLEDGTRVFFGGPRRPYGSMAQRVVAPRAFCFPVPNGLDDATAAALLNPGVSAWLSLARIGKLEAGEGVLILGATGVTGKLAVQIAKLLGAGRVTAAGRNEQVLGTLRDLGADATIQLHQPDRELAETFAREINHAGIQVIIDYLWGRPTEILLGAITRAEFGAIESQMRLVQVGASAGPAISLPAAVLRSRAIAILGTAGIPSREVLEDAFRQVMNRASAGELRIDTERVPLRDVERAWHRQVQGGRLVLIP
jgi:NADPH:quinone reductase-like Zn-dependent oxidoreductase